VALCAAGVLAEEDLIALSEARGRFIVEAAGSEPGTMAAIKAGAHAVSEALEDSEGIWIANQNAPKQTIISGTQLAVEEAIKKFQSSGIQARPIPVACAFHSPIVSQASERLREFLSGMNLDVPHLEVYSNTTARPYPTEPKAIAEQLVQHLVSRVEFVREVEAMYEDGTRIFVEVGPGRVLSGLVDQILGDRPHLAVISNQAGRSGLVELQHLLGQFIVHGAPVKMDRIYKGRSVKEIDLKALGTERHQADLSLTTWLVNGARAKPLGVTSRSDPHRAVAPMGLTFAQEQVLPASDEAQKDQALTSNPPLSPLEAQQPTSTGQPGSPESKSLASSPASEDEVTQVMLQFQKLMNRFLDTQKNVMMRYLQNRGAEVHESQDTLKAQTALTTAVQQDCHVPSTGDQPDVSPQIASSDQMPPGTSTTPVSGSIAPSPQVSASPGRQELTSRLLQIVSQRTGYPQDMLGLDLDLEADLGIDSIKRVEILGHFLQCVFPTGRVGPPEQMEGLTRIKTLRGIIEGVEAYKGTSGRSETPEISVSSTVQTSEGPSVLREKKGVPRFTLTAINAPPPSHSVGLAPKRVVMVTDDERGIAQALAEKLTARGHEVAIVQWGETRKGGGTHSYGLKDSSVGAIGELVDTIRKHQGSVGCLIHLFPLKKWVSYEHVDLAGWRGRLHLETKTLFHFLKFLEKDLNEAAGEGGACVVSATGMGGSFASVPGADRQEFFPGQGAIPGLLKTVDVEWPKVRVKAVDLNLDEPVSHLADHLLSEIETDDDLVEVGYDGSRRLSLGLVETPLVQRVENFLEIDSSWVILVTGGARGITAQVARELARRYRPILILAGRSPLPPKEESGGTTHLTQAHELKGALISRMKAEGKAFQLVDVERAYQQLLKEREIRSNLGAMRNYGAKVEYFQVEVRDSLAFGSVIDEVYRNHGRLDGVIHGAGIIEDKLFKDKTWESFDRVFGTKTESVFVLSRKLQPETLRFLVLFSSVAGRFGNAGQSDYTAANDVLNKLAVYLDERWPGRTLSVNWGPWTGAGMASQEVQRQFAERGVGLVSPSEGPDLFDLEIRKGRKGEVEVVIGDGPWKEGPSFADPCVVGMDSLPLLQNITSCTKNAGFLEIIRCLDPAHDLYLLDHRLDGKSVLPAAVAIELMAEAAQTGWPEWKVTAVHDIRVFKGIVLNENCGNVRILVRPKGDMAPQPLKIKVEVTINDTQKPEATFYRAAVILSRTLLPPPEHEIPTDSGMNSFWTSADGAYEKWLFHGPRFQCIQSIEGISKQGMLATLSPSLPKECLAGEPQGHWLMDPVVLDGGLQLALLWARNYLDITILPSRFKKVHLFKPFPRSSSIRCYSQVLEEFGGQSVYSNLYFVDPEGSLICLIEGFEATGSSALNRLGGSHLL